MFYLVSAHVYWMSVDDQLVAHHVDGALGGFEIA